MAVKQDGIKLIVGIDYGTTYSGISFALSNAADFKDILPWTKYPGASSHNAEHCVKAPTRIAFEDENDDLTENAWGYQIEPGLKIYAMTKLLLDKSTLQSNFDDPDLYLPSGGEMMQLPKGKSAKDVATAYLKEMCKMFETARDEIFGADQLLPTDFWLTVPASWSEKAKLLTKAAAMDAGFGKKSADRIMLISEPEAAAHYALKSSIHRLESFVKDITTYEVEETQPTLKLREIAVGVAGKCGGTFVDRNLFKLLGQRFGDAFTSLGTEQIGPGSLFMDLFESKKKDFSSHTSSRRACRIPLYMPLLQNTTEMDKYYDRRVSAVMLTEDDFRFMFDPVVNMVIDLINEQVSQIKKKNETAIETIVLVGGFGSSPYLKELISEWCLERGMRLTTPMSGAGFMYWEIGKGDIIDKTTEVNCKFVVYFTGQVSGTRSHNLYSCSLDDGPETIENDRIEEVGSVVYDVTGVNEAELKKAVKDGVTTYALKLVLNTRLDDEIGHLVFRILYDGKEIGKAGIDIGDS
ncbi:hypothetical protein QQS21_007823 [Conoideocrella luteorostrata]|uniref:Actin-like ATPase domain-containing protein n=1 Tax=Conoideocrella luteorostrata TaxID=1105319 RepID=A0AAJ0FRR5_9HYPO|nr:hypothetical protein QQS21_007823 [Conoideocrella luteorostrata]